MHGNLYQPSPSHASCGVVVNVGWVKGESRKDGVCWECWYLRKSLTATVLIRMDCALHCHKQHCCCEGCLTCELWCPWSHMSLSTSSSLPAPGPQVPSLRPSLSWFFSLFPSLSATWTHLLVHLTFYLKAESLLSDAIIALTNSSTMWIHQ